MMLVSRDLKQYLALMTLGATLLSGCASSPGTGFTRFWPKKDNAASVAHDEELAAKWRARIDGQNQPEITANRNDNPISKADEPREKPRRGFLRFPWNRDKQNDTVDLDEYQKLEARLAQLEAERRESTPDRRSEAANVNLTRRGAMDDPFLKAEQLNRNRNLVEASPQSSRPAGGSSTAGLPQWAGNSAPSRDRFQAPIIAPQNSATAQHNFAPGFEETLKNLATEVESESPKQAVAAVRTPQASAAPFPAEAMNANVTRTAPAMPESNFPSSPDSAKPSEAPRAPRIPQVAATETPVAQPKLDPPIADDTAARHPLSGLKSVDEQRNAWATLEVRQLMKHARIQARANQFEAAMKTVLAAEQLANNAQLEFTNNEQTPAELIMVLKYHIEQLEGDALVAAKAPTETAPPTVAQVPAPPVADAKLPSWPHGIQVRPTSSSEVAATPSNVTTAVKRSTEPPKTESPATNLPQWPAQNVSMKSSDEPKGSYIESRPGYSTRTRAQLITSGSIYSSENLRWAKLESERATLKDSRADRHLVEQSHTHDAGIPPAPVDEDDPFAAAFGSSDAVDEAIHDELPEALIAPEIPAEGTPMASVWDDEVFGIPLRKIALLTLAGLILLAAIIHRRRNNLEQA